MNFVEGFHYVKGDKSFYDSPIWVTIRGKPIEISIWTIQHTLGIEGHKTSNQFEAQQGL